MIKRGRATSANSVFTTLCHDECGWDALEIRRTLSETVRKGRASMRGLLMWSWYILALIRMKISKLRLRG